MGRVVADGGSAMTIPVPTGGTSEAVSISAVSAPSAALQTRFVLVTSTVDCFVRSSAAPVAVSDGTDMLLLAGNQYMLYITRGEKLAFVTTGATGTVYVSPIPEG